MAGLSQCIRKGAGVGMMAENETKTEFEKAAEEERISLVTEFLYFLKDNKKWWLLPILLVLLGVGALAMLSGTGAAPFIYTLF
jgi:hypothetical protein